jgi:hypothetical protein
VYIQAYYVVRIQANYVVQLQAYYVLGMITIRDIFRPASLSEAPRLPACSSGNAHPSPEVPAPNFILDTSPGKHQIVWSVEGLELREAESMLRAMAAEYGGDPAATDAARVLRLPGFTNKKYDDEFVVVAHQESTERYQAHDFQLPEDSSGRSRNVFNGARTKTGEGHRSQSEQDWAYAKRALAQEIMRRIADFRAEEKPNPEYYARHTVEKAGAALRRPVTAPSPEVAQTSDPPRDMP